MIVITFKRLEYMQPNPIRRYPTPTRYLTPQGLDHLRTGEGGDDWWTEDISEAHEFGSMKDAEWALERLKKKSGPPDLYEIVELTQA